MSEPTDDELRIEIAIALGYRWVRMPGFQKWWLIAPDITFSFIPESRSDVPPEAERDLEVSEVPHWPTDPAAAMALLDCEQLKECHFELERDEEWIASIGAHIAFANTPARAISRVALKALEGMKAEAQ